jgi:hypothetical protein
MSRGSVCLVALLLAAPVRAQTVTIVAPPPPPPPGMAGVPAQRDKPLRPGTAVLRGRVMAADTGQPLRRAQVRIIAPEIRENRMTTTDVEGRYEFKEVHAGRYTITALKGSYVSLQYGQQRPFEAGRPLEILDSQIVEKVDFMLPRGGVITGRILDEFGEPLSDAQVSAMRYQTIGGRRRLVNAGRIATTNDIGEFRLFAIPPGQYYLSATLRNMNMMGDSDDRSGYAPTYFPGTPTIGDAQRITIGVGQILNEVTMALMPTRTAQVSGTAFDSQGRPMTGAIMAAPKGDTVMMMFGPPGQIRPDGSFSVNGLAPGTYTLQSQPMGSADAESASAEVVVNGDDISGVRLVGSRPSTLSGRVIIDLAAARSLRASQFRVMAMPVQNDGIMFGPMLGPAAVNDDWTFEIKARPGGPMRMSLGGSPAGWALRAVRYRGMDVTDSGIEFRPGEDVAEIEIDVTNQITEVSGLVTNSRGESSKDYSVLVFPQDRERWMPGSRYVRTGRPDQDGRFKVPALPAGSYYAVAMDYLDAGDASDPAVLERMLEKATTFSLNDGEKKTLDLKLNTSS